MWSIYDSFSRKEYVNERWFGFAIVEHDGIQQEIGFKFAEEPSAVEISARAEQWVEEMNYVPPEPEQPGEGE